MIKILTGPDSYRIDEQIKKVKEKFQEKTKAVFGIVKIDATQSNFAKIRQEVISNGFFDSYKLVIINDFLKLPEQDLKDLYKLTENLPANIALVLVSKGQADKRRLKKWQKFDCFEADRLSYNQIENWIQKRVEEEGGKIDFLAKKKLSEFVGCDLERLNQEILKLVSFKNRGKILIEDVELLVKPSINPSIFNLIDYIGLNQTKAAIQELNKLLESGEHELYIFTMVVYGFRNLILVKGLADLGNNSSQIVAKLKMHPFVVSKTLSQIKRFTMPQLKLIYSKLLNAEQAIKTGKNEPRLILEILVGTLAR